MYVALRAGALALILSLLPGCGKDKAVGPKPTEITGLWNATKVEYVRKADPPLRVNLIAPDTTATCAINSDKTYVFIVRRAGQVPDTTRGTWRLDGDQFMVTLSATPLITWAWDAGLTSNTLTLTGADMWYDFNGDDLWQSEEEADNNTVLVR
jgi:hypothetical protein